MKDKIVAWIRITIWVLLIWYIGYILKQNWIIVKESINNLNMIIIIIIWLLWWFFLIMGIHPIAIKRFKIIQVIFWIILILFSHYFLKDNPSKNIYIADILKVLWVFMVIIWPTWFCIPEKIKKQIEESKIEIIEV